MEVLFGAASICRCLYSCLLIAFIYEAFVSSAAYALPYPTSSTFHSQNGGDTDLLEDLNAEDVLKICARADISTSTKVLCRLVGVRERWSEPVVLPMKQLRSRRVHRGELMSLSDFQRIVDFLRERMHENATYRTQYNLMVSLGLINSDGVAIAVPDAAMQQRMREIMGSGARLPGTSS